MRTAILTILTLLLLSMATLAQESKPSPITPLDKFGLKGEWPPKSEQFGKEMPVAIRPEERDKVGSQERSMSETYLSLGVLLFGIIILFLEVGVLLRQRQGWGTNSTRIVGLTLVVVCGVFLITSGYSEKQIAPMIGLLGTIVGYLLGKSDSPSK